MEATFDHNKLLKKTAKERLTPFGITQKGSSRTFLFDNDWWTIIIEFQPSSFSKGSYLNIGLDFNFYPRDHFAFTYGYRENGFEEADNETTFIKIINDYCDLTITKLDDLKVKFKDVWTATNTFKKHIDKDPWNKFDLAILYSLTGNISDSRKLLNDIKKQKCEYDYEFKRQQLVTEILLWFDDDETFLSKIKELINQTRQLKKLPVVNLDNLQERKTTPNIGIANSGTDGKPISIWNSIKQRFGLTNKAKH
jgi:hypothetical protein